MKKLLTILFFILFVITSSASPLPVIHPTIHSQIPQIISQIQNGESSSLDGLIEIRKTLNLSYNELDNLLMTPSNITLDDDIKELASSFVSIMENNFLDFFLIVFGNHKKLSPPLDLDTQKELLIDFFLDEYDQGESSIFKDLLIHEILKQLSALLFPRDEHNIINNQLVVFWKSKLQPCNNEFNKLTLYRAILENFSNNSFQYVLSGCFDAHRVYSQNSDLVKEIFFDFVSTYNKPTISETILQSINTLSESALEDFSYDNLPFNKLIKILSHYEKISKILISDHYKYNIFYLDNLQAIYSKLQVLLVDKKINIKSSLFSQASPYLQLYLLKANMDQNNPTFSLLKSFNLEDDILKSPSNNEMDIYRKSFLNVEFLRHKIELSKHNNQILNQENTIISGIKKHIFQALQIRFDNISSLDDLLNKSLSIFDNKIINDNKYLTINRCNNNICQNILLPPGIYGNENIKINCNNLEFHPLSYFYSPSKTIEINCQSTKNLFIDVSGRDAEAPLVDSALIKFYLESPLPKTKQVGNDVLVDWFEGTQELFSLNPKSLASGLSGAPAGQVKINSDRSYGVNIILLSGGNGSDGIDGIDSKLWNKETNSFSSLVLDTGKYWVETRTERVCWTEEWPCEGDRPRRSSCARQRCENRTSHTTHFNKQPTSITIYPLQAGNGGNGGDGGSVFLSSEIFPKTFVSQKGGNQGLHGKIPLGDIFGNPPSDGAIGMNGKTSIIQD